VVTRFGEFRLDPQRRQLSRGGETVHLTPKAFELLSALVE
jgi:DNA-binding winged helix-turn-helix (wHTH) protein